MSTLSATTWRSTQRYEALLRATNAIGISSDCDAAAETIVEALRAWGHRFRVSGDCHSENDGWTVTWHLLHSNGVTQRWGCRTSSEWHAMSRCTCQQALVVANWNEEPRFRKHGQFLSKLDIAATCVLPLARDSDASV